MQIYSVINTSDADSQVTLRDDEGHLHIARATSHLPALGGRLEGGRAAPGFAMMMCPDTGRVVRLIFVRVGGESPQAKRRSEA